MINIPVFEDKHKHYFDSKNDMLKWLILNTARILRSDTNKSFLMAWYVSVAQMDMDVNTEWYHELRFSLDDLSTKSNKELAKQQYKFVLKNITPHHRNNHP